MCDQKGKKNLGYENFGGKSANVISLQRQGRLTTRAV
jgi:hypothetical protein